MRVGNKYGCASKWTISIYDNLKAMSLEKSKRRQEERKKQKSWDKQKMKDKVVKTNQECECL